MQVDDCVSAPGAFAGKSEEERPDQLTTLESDVAAKQRARQSRAAETPGALYVKEDSKVASKVRCEDSSELQDFRREESKSEEETITSYAEMPTTCTSAFTPIRSDAVAPGAHYVKGDSKVASKVREESGMSVPGVFTGKSDPLNRLEDAVAVKLRREETYRGRVQ
jgi:hypothetical protein